MHQTWRERLRRLWREWVRPFVLILVAMGTLRSAVADWNHVPTGSMKPTILEGDRIFVNKLAYDLRVPFTRLRLMHWSNPERGDLVVFFSPANGSRLVKRVIGVPGDRIEMRANRLFVNGRSATYEPLPSDSWPEVRPRDYRVSSEKLGKLDHPVMTIRQSSPRSSFLPVTVPEGRYFVMGDNRDESLDSRWFGFVDRELIVGRAVGIAISVDPEHHYLPRWQRFFTGLP